MKKEIEKEPYLFIALSALVQVAFLIIAQTAPDDLLMTTRDPRSQRQKVIQALKITPEQLEEEKKKEEAKKEDEIRKNKDCVADEELKVEKNVIPVDDPDPEVVRRNPLVDKLQRKPKEDLSKLTPEQRQDRAKQLAQQTAMSQAFRQNNPLFDKLMTNPDLDSKPSPFKALGLNDPNGAENYGDNGNVNPFSGFDTSSNGFMPSDGGLPNGSPDGGPAISATASTRTRTAVTSGRSTSTRARPSRVSSSRRRASRASSTRRPCASTSACTCRASSGATRTACSRTASSAAR